MAESAQTKIRVRGLYKSFGAKEVLRGIDLDLAAGESLVVMGGSGSGKSVMLKCILGLMQPDAGEIIINGRDVSTLTGSAAMRARGDFAMLFQNGALFDSLPVWENVAFGLIHAQKMNRRAAKKIALEKLAQVGLPESTGELWPDDLSGGMRKRVALARAIAGNPDVVMFDEPTTGLDPIMAGVINELIVATVRDLGASAISITHDMASARTIASRAAMIYQGRIIWNAPASEIDKSGDPYVEQFVRGQADGPIEIEGLRRPS